MQTRILYKTIAAVFALCQLAVFNAEAKKTPVIEQARLLSVLPVNNNFTVDDGVCTSLSPGSNWNQGWCFSNAQGRVVLSIIDNFGSCPPASFTCTVTARAEYFSHEDNAQHTEDLSLTVAYDSKAGTSYRQKDMKILPQGVNFIKITLLGVSNAAAIPFLQLSGEIEQERQKCTLDLTTKLTFQSVNYNSTTNEIEIAINNTLKDHADEYDLEWTFVDEFDAAAVATNGPRFNFKNNATRVTIPTETYSINNVFEEGYLVFRTRIVAYYTDGAGLARRAVGPWSHTVISGFPDEGLVGYNTGASYHITGSSVIHEAQLNWLYSISFAEEGKKNDAATYYDGSMRVRQLVGHNYADATAVVQETIYDYEGRPAITTMPVPVKAGTMKFYENFNRNAGGIPYSAADFDVNTAQCAAQTQPMNTTSGSSKYYSTNNEFATAANPSAPQPNKNDYVPVANNFPFTQTEFVADNTGRIQSQSSPGDKYVMGSTGSHATKFFYSVPEQYELDRLFGTEAGDYRRYKKQTVVDANGQASVSYLNMYGKVIATALKGNVQGVQLFEIDLINHDEDPDISGGEIVVNKTFTVTTAGNYGFKYEVVPQRYFPAPCPPKPGEEESPQLCYECVYDLNISLTDQCGREQFNGKGPSQAKQLISRTIGGDPAVINNAGGAIATVNSGCNTAVKYSLEDDNLLDSYIGVQNYLILTLQPGTYTLTKSLKPREDIIEKHLEEFLNTQQCKTLEDFEQEAWDAIDKSGCELTCETCSLEMAKPQYSSEAIFVDYKINQFTASGGLASDITDEMIEGWKTIFADEKEKCDRTCGKSTPCEVYKDIVIADMSPGGQYAAFVYDVNGDGQVDPAETRMNILKDVGQSYHYATVFAVNETVVVDGNTVPIRNLTVAQFIKQWDLHEKEWGERFMQYHPEYCEYEWCTETEGARAYTERMANIETYDEAVNAGFLFSESQSVLTVPGGKTAAPLKVIVPITQISGVTNVRDPLFANEYPFNFDLYSAMWGEMWSYKTVAGVSFSMWDIPVYETYCSNLPDNTGNQIVNCINSNRDDMLACKPYRDWYWKTIRSLYMDKQQQAINALKGNRIPPCNPVISNGERRFFNADIIEAQKPTLEPDVNAAMQQYGEEQCAAYRDMWKEKLKGCYTGLMPLGSSLTQAQLMEELLDKMENVCVRGFDSEHTFGSASVSPANYVTGDFFVYNSFEEVLKRPFYYNDGSTVVIYPARYVEGVCDDVFITMPQPYGHDYFADKDPETNRCACDPSISASDPECPCNSAAVSQQVNDIIILSRTDVPEEKKCKNCMDCAEFTWYYNAFLAEHGPFNERSGEQQDMLTAYINKKSGFNLRFVEYRTHVLKCLNLPDTIPFPFAKFEELHASSLTTSAGLNNNTPPGGDTTLYAVKKVDCQQFLNLLDAFMAEYPSNGLIFDVNLNRNTYYQWLSTYWSYGLMTDLQSRLLTTFGVSFTQNDLVEQLRYCLPLDCREFLTRWKFHTPNAPETRRQLQTEPYYSSTFASDIIDMNSGILNETFGNSLWTTYLNPGTMYIYPQLAASPVFTKQSAKQYIDMCAVQYCAFALSQKQYNQELYTVLDPEDAADGNVTTANLLLSVLFKKISGTPILISENINLSSAAPGIFPLIPFSYTYPSTATYNKTLLTSSNNTVEGTITAFNAPPVKFSMKTILLYGTLGTSAVTLGRRSAYIPVDPSANFSYANVTACQYISTVSYNYSEVQLIYKLTYSGSGFTGRVQHVLVTLPAFCLSGSILDEGCYTKNTICNVSIGIITQPEAESPCLQRLRVASKTNALHSWENYIEGVKELFRAEYISKCREAFGTEEFSRTENDSIYHFTLYYYNQAQNLVKTIPPEGVVLAIPAAVKIARDANATLLPGHILPTAYAYNTLNRLIWEKTPDAGISQFYYDEVGRIILSQNAEQNDRLSTISKYVYSYTLYDNRSRIKEVGEIQANANPVSFTLPWVTYSSLTAWMTAPNGTTAQTTKTYYDLQTETNPALFPYTQTNLRNRVSKMSYHELGSNGVQNSATYYSYDIHGNVARLIRQTDALHTTYFDEEFRTIDYEYDLVSGNTKKVYYQKGESDQYIHVYKYDAMNRLYTASSGYRNELIDQDAAYEYYLHGPLARTQVGKLKVQGVDYAYTLQGWLKGVNSGSLKNNYDIGRDGYTPPSGVNNNQLVMPDEYGFILQYYEGDYSASGSSASNAFSPATNGSALGNASVNLYNGNIKMMTTAIGKFMQNNLPPLAAAYSYDELSRLKDASYYNNIDANVWSASGAALSDYHNQFTYDKNGNINTQLRNGSSAQGLAMDNLIYHYKTGDHKNQLDYVSEDPTITEQWYSDDIKSQSGTNYEYDKIGNLKADPSEQILKIEWNVYGKIKRIIRTSASLKPDLEFEYTPDGHRAVKIVIPKTPGSTRTYTYYVRDVQGNIMATYTRQFDKVVDFENLTYSQVNVRLAANLGQPGFADFVAVLHTATIPNSTGLRTAINNNMKALSSANKLTFLQTNVAYGQMLASDDIVARNFVVDMPLEDLKGALLEYFTVKDPDERSTMADGTDNNFRTCYFNVSNADPDYDVFAHTVCSDPRVLEAMFRFLYIADNGVYYNLVRNYFGFSGSNLEADIVSMNAGYSEPAYRHLMVKIKSDNSIPQEENDLWFGPAFTSSDPVKEEAFALFMARFYKQYMLINQNDFLGDGPVAPCFNGSNMSNVINDVVNNRYAGDAATAWNLLLNFNPANYHDPEDPATVPARNENYYLDLFRDNYAYEHIYDIANHATYSSYITGYQQTNHLYSASGNGIRAYLDLYKARFGQAAYDLVINHFLSTTNSYSDSFNLSEHHIYGAGRVGVRKYNLNLAYGIYDATAITNGAPVQNPGGPQTAVVTTFSVTALQCSFMRGEKSYELSNHLGNVLVVLSDKRIYSCSASAYVADVLQVNDYSPFGAPLANRSWNLRIILDNQFSTTTEGWNPLSGGGTHSIENGKLKIVASNTCSTEKQIATDVGCVYELAFDADDGTFDNIKVEIFESVASGKPVNTTYTTSNNGRHLVYFKAATNEMFIRFSPQTNATGSRTAYFNYVTVRRISSKQAPGNLAYTENLTVVTRTGNTPTTYIASGSIVFDNGFESESLDVFETFIEQTIFVSEGAEREDYRFGFNGQEQDDEVSGEGNSYTAEYWQYDGRLGRRWNLDPVDQISISNYAVNRNCPILFTDPHGDYSKFGAQWRNAVFGGDGISYTQSTGEWGYKNGDKDGYGFTSGISDEEAQERVAKYRETHTWVNDIGWVENATLRASDNPDYMRNFLKMFGTICRAKGNPVSPVIVNGLVGIPNDAKIYGSAIVNGPNNATDLDGYYVTRKEVTAAGFNTLMWADLAMAPALKGLSVGKTPRIYIPENPLAQQKVAGWDIPLPDPIAGGAPHTTLGGKMGSDGVLYRQSATFTGGSWPLANGEIVPWSRMDWTTHGRPLVHPDPHQHIFNWNGTNWEYGKATH
jgi:hypothetical protein